MSNLLKPSEEAGEIATGRLVTRASPQTCVTVQIYVTVPTWEWIVTCSIVVFEHPYISSRPRCGHGWISTHRGPASQVRVKMGKGVVQKERSCCDGYMAPVREQRSVIRGEERRQKLRTGKGTCGQAYSAELSAAWLQFRPHSVID